MVIFDLRIRVLYGNHCDFIGKKAFLRDLIGFLLFISQRREKTQEVDNSTSNDFNWTCKQRLDTLLEASIESFLIHQPEVSRFSFIFRESKEHFQQSLSLLKYLLLFKEHLQSFHKQSEIGQATTIQDRRSLTMNLCRDLCLLRFLVLFGINTFNVGSFVFQAGMKVRYSRVMTSAT